MTDRGHYPMSLSYKKVLVSGIVQGVGFRPFCARTALEMGVAGAVRNTSEGVVLELEGEAALLDAYLNRLETEQPDAAHITSIEIIENDESRFVPAFGTFSIERSIRREEQKVLIPPDIATCDDCLAELEDPENRRYHYPFINCTNCGPRYTIIKDLPYDRPLTTMSSFPLCERCREEYEAPADRRFHAQPNACSDCGPRLELTDSRGGMLATGDDAIAVLVNDLLQGKIAAIKGLGGFHLACDARSDTAVEMLRKRKHRPHKPLAIMVRDVEAADSIVVLSPTAQRLLGSTRRPIVLCPIRKGNGLSPRLAPGQTTLGIMLPYTPLHHLLMKHFRALVMTSANRSDAPIVCENDAALRELSSIADIFLMHNRDIHMPIDDSVVMPYGKSAILIRRARGFVPSPVSLPFRAPVIAGAGGEMKATFAISQENLVFPGQFLGDLKQLETVVFYKRAMTHLLRLYNLHPKYLAYDMHPQYLSTHAAKESLGDAAEETLAVQHHFAHMAACMIDNGHHGDTIGVIFDGTGYGEDGALWGGEFLAGNLEGYRRIASLYQTSLPGGEKAILEPWRFALSLLKVSFDAETAIALGATLWPEYSINARAIVNTMHSAQKTTSCGRLFDGVSAILGIRSVISYDGQAAMELEAVARGRLAAPFALSCQEGFWILDWRPAIRWIADRIRSVETSVLSEAFHRGLSRSVAELCEILSRRTGIRHIALSGGVWQNKRLLSLTERLLRRRGLIPLIHHSLSPNDECVSVGQVAIGAAKWRK